MYQKISHRLMTMIALSTDLQTNFRSSKTPNRKYKHK